MIAVVGGIAAGFIHRFGFSPTIGTLKRKTQSVATPAVGVCWAYLFFKLAYRSELRRIVPDAEMRREIEHAVDDSYRGVYFAYGFVVAATLALGVGGKKK